MSRLPFFSSDVDLHRDEEGSLSQSQVRARPAIRLDTSLSFISTTSLVGGGGATSGTASPLLGGADYDGNSMNVASPLLFQPRDPNVDASGQHDAFPLKASHGRTLSDCRSRQATSRLCSLQQRRTALSPRSTSFNRNLPLPHREAIEALESEATVLTCPAHLQLHEKDDSKEGEIGSQQVRSTTISPAPRRAAELTDRFDGGFSFPGSEDRNHETQWSEGEEGANTEHLPAIAATVSLNDVGDAVAREEDGPREDWRSRSGSTPPPRRAFVLSRRYSSAEEEVDDVFHAEAARPSADATSAVAPPADEHAKTKGDSGLEREEAMAVVRQRRPSIPRPNVADRAALPSIGAVVHEADHHNRTAETDGNAYVARDHHEGSKARPEGRADDDPNLSYRRHSSQNRVDAVDWGVESFVVNTGSTESVDLGQVSQAVTGAVAASARSSTRPPVLPIGQLVPGVVMEEGDEEVAAETAAASIGRRCEGEADEAVRCVSPHLPGSARDGEAAKHRDCLTLTSQPMKPEGRFGASPLLLVSRGGSSAQLSGETPLTVVAAEGDTIRAASAPAMATADVTPDTVGIDSSTGPLSLPISGTTEEAVVSTVHVTSESLDVSHVPQVAEMSTSSLHTARIAGPSSPSAAPNTTTATSMNMSSLWLVSGSTPTPLRRLRDREGQEDNGGNNNYSHHRERRSMGLDSAQVRNERDRGHQEKEEGEATTAANAAENGSRLWLHASEHPPGTPPSSAGAPTRVSGPADAVEPRTGMQRSSDSIHGMLERRHAACVSPPLATSTPVRDDRTPSTPSFSPEPAPPHRDPHHSPSRSPISVAVGNGELVRPAHPPRAAAIPPSRRDTAVFHDALVRREAVRTVAATTPPQRSRAQLEAAPALPSPSSMESMRVSEEVRGLVERAQEQVRRTRESLLSTLREHRASFRLTESSPVSEEEPSASAATPGMTVASKAMTSAAVAYTSPGSPATPTRSLLLPSETPAVTMDRNSTRTSGEVRSTAAGLRSQLRAAADAILHRLQGYDERDHGVLPMETVARVAYFVVMRREMPVSTWSLRTAEGGVASTPMRASLVLSSDPTALQLRDVASSTRTIHQPHHRSPLPGKLQRSAYEEGVSKGLVFAARLATEHTSLETPLQSQKSRVADQDKARLHAAVVRTHPASPMSGAKRSREVVRYEAAVANGPLEQLPDRPETKISPSRTLERVMALQQRRAEEERLLQFYCVMLEAFKQVFGERYAWQHLGATNASRHDRCLPLAQGPPAMRRQRTEATLEKKEEKAERRQDQQGTIAAEEETAHLDEEGLEVENEFNGVAGPLETLFPRLRQHYALRRQERQELTVSASATMARAGERPKAELGGAATSATHDIALRPPPLDVLVYYRTFVESLREL